MNPRLLSALACVCALGCVSAPPPPELSENSPELPREIRQQPPEQATVLYARDGTPVSASGPSGAQEPSGPLSARDLAGGQGGRMYILELYQNVIEERDVLSHEVLALGDELERARQALLSADQRGMELETRLAAAAEENQRLAAENVDLAGRLTTAQIRRLQAEKILLEQRLAEIGAVSAAGSRQQP